MSVFPLDKDHHQQQRLKLYCQNRMGIYEQLLGIRSSWVWSLKTWTRLTSCLLILCEALIQEGRGRIVMCFSALSGSSLMDLKSSKHLDMSLFPLKKLRSDPVLSWLWTQTQQGGGLKLLSVELQLSAKPKIFTHCDVTRQSEHFDLLYLTSPLSRIKFKQIPWLSKTKKKQFSSIFCDRI